MIYQNVPDRMSLLVSALLLGAMSGGLGCTEGEGDSELLEPAPATSTAHQSLFVSSGTTLWSARNHQGEIRVPMCWLNAGYDAQKQLIKDAVARTWEAAANVRFEWRATCPFTGPATDRWVRVSIRIGGTGSAGSANLGIDAASAPQDPVWCANAYGIFVPCRGADLELGTDRRSAEHVIIHEVGHVLGFDHEQNRADAEARGCSSEVLPGVGVGAYDPESIMNYCSSSNSRLSEGDVVNVEAVYGRRWKRPDLLADLEGDGRADAIATNWEGSYAISSSGWGFVDWRRISSGFYGENATAYADLDGDGDDDGVVVDYGGIYVLRSNGWTLDERPPPTPLWERWSGPFYGLRKTLFGDIDGDGRSDVVAANPEQVWTARSSGDSFGDVTTGPPVFGTLQTDLADVDGDGRADLIANDGKRGIRVALSHGSGFEAPRPWTFPRSFGFFGRLSFLADRELAFGDVNGDGRSDAIAVRYSGIFVRLSTGTEFLPEQRWTDAPFVGDRATLFADLGGDGMVDVVGVGNDAEHVLYSVGDKFVSFGAWTTYPFYSMP